MAAPVEPILRSVSFAPDLARLPEARRFVRDSAAEAGFAETRLFDITVACSEAVANAIEHASGEEWIVVDARIFRDRLEVAVRGTGEFEMPDHSAKHRHRGLGLPLMAKFADHLALYTVAHGGTLVTLAFYREPTGRQAEWPPPGFTQPV